MGCGGGRHARELSGIDGILMYMVDKGLPGTGGPGQGRDAAEGCELEDAEHYLGGKDSQGVHTFWSWAGPAYIPARPTTPAT